MKRLILVRHATAVDRGPEGSDFHRGLKKRGKREAQVMAERVAPVLGTPDQIFSSPADRALQTARIFADRLGVPAERVVLREELYGGLLPDEFLHIVHRFDDGAGTVMVFGHDPCFTEFAAHMIPNFTDSIPKAGVVVMEIARSTWRTVHAGDARLVQFERPPAKDNPKRSKEDTADRMLQALDSRILAAVLDLGVENSRDVTRLVTRAATRLARELRPFAKNKSGTDKKKKEKKKKERAPKAKEKKAASNKSRRRSA